MVVVGVVVTVIVRQASTFGGAILSELRDLFATDASSQLKLTIFVKFHVKNNQLQMVGGCVFSNFLLIGLCFAHATTMR